LGGTPAGSGHARGGSRLWPDAALLSNIHFQPRLSPLPPPFSPSVHALEPNRPSLSAPAASLTEPAHPPQTSQSSPA
jgi:hypothetical protein